MDTAGKPESLFERLRRRFGHHRREARAEDILQMLQQARREQTIGADTLQQLENVLRFSSMSVRDAMVSRARMDVINVDNGTDYRRRTLEQVPLYHSPLGAQADAAMQDAFTRLAGTADESPVIEIEGREITACRRAGGVIWFDFKTLCGGLRSQNDYLEIASRYHTLLLSDVPQMHVHNASEARRFTLLVDVLYDRRVKFMLSAAVPPEQLYIEGPLAHEFPRTVSRLMEMQSAEYLALEHRAVDTQLT